MSRFLIPAAAIVLIAAVFSACEDSGDPGETGFPTLTPYFAADYLTNSGYAEVADDCRNSTPHGISIRVHISPASQASNYTNRAGRLNQEFPVGTIIVKTEYSQPACGGNVWRVTAMRKGAAGTAPATNDWEWQEFDYDDMTEQQGAGLGTCLSCHSDPNVLGCGPEYDYTCLIP